MGQGGSYCAPGGCRPRPASQEGGAGGEHALPRCLRFAPAADAAGAAAAHSSVTPRKTTAKLRGSPSKRHRAARERGLCDMHTRQCMRLAPALAAHLRCRAGWSRCTDLPTRSQRCPSGLAPAGNQKSATTATTASALCCQNAELHRCSHNGDRACCLRMQVLSGCLACQRARCVASGRHPACRCPPFQRINTLQARHSCRTGQPMQPSFPTLTCGM